MNSPRNEKKNCSSTNKDLMNPRSNLEMLMSKVNFEKFYTFKIEFKMSLM